MLQHIDLELKRMILDPNSQLRAAFMERDSVIDVFAEMVDEDEGGFLSRLR